ncbi:hypothetical protein [Clostridium senegalense]
MQDCIIECFYVDTQSDYDFYKNNIKMFANAIVYGITEVDLGRNNKPQIVGKLNKNEL